MLLTVFTIPKSFRGHDGVIQRNAIRSWQSLGSDVDVVLFGDDDGVAATAEELGARYISNVDRTEYGTPLLSSVFTAARAQSDARLLAYVNADIILLGDFAAACAELPEAHLMVGRRWDVDLYEELDFGPCWESELRQTVAGTALLAPAVWIDYFVFPRTSPLTTLPPFAVGRPYWDQWMIYRARSLNIPVVDASRRVYAIHQSHGYAHVPAGSGDRWQGPEAEANAALAGDMPLMSIEHATHVLTARGVRQAIGVRYLRARWKTRRSVDGHFERFARVVAPVLLPAVRVVRRARR